MRHILPILIGVVVVVGGGWVLLTVVHGRDAAGVTAGGGDPTGPGPLEPDRGDVVRPGAGVGRHADPAPTSGTHARRTPTREGRLDDAQLLTTLALGDVALVYGARRPPAGLTRARDDLAGAFDPELAAAGQAVLLVRRPGSAGLQALAWRRRLDLAGATDPNLSGFVDAWLGRGATAGR